MTYIAGLKAAVLKPAAATLKPSERRHERRHSPKLCNECHPFYTGKLKYIDTAGRIDKFQKKFAAGTYGSLASKGKK